MMKMRAKSKQIITSYFEGADMVYKGAIREKKRENCFSGHKDLF